MKKRSPHRFSLSAFTLIELLVVISIIAVLASLTFSGVGTAMVAAKKVQAKNDMAQIANAVQFYYTEYGKYPTGAATSGTTDLVFGKAESNNKIINVLRYRGPNNWTDTNNENPRQIKFIEPKLVSMAKGGVYDSLGATGDGNWYDPWGTQYLIFIDGDYGSDILVNTCFGGVGDGDGKVPVSVGAASVGYYYAYTKASPQPQTIGSSLSFTGENAIKVKKTVLLSWQ